MSSSRICHTAFLERLFHSFPAIFFQTAKFHSTSFEADALLTLQEYVSGKFQIATKPRIPSLNNLLWFTDSG
jgi:hypothetical protein